VHLYFQPVTLVGMVYRQLVRLIGILLGERGFLYSFRDILSFIYSAFAILLFGYSSIV